MPARRVVLHAVAILVLLAAVLPVAGCAIPTAAVRNHQVNVAALSGGYLVAVERRGGLRRVFSDQSLFGPFGYGTQVASSPLQRSGSW